MRWAWLTMFLAVTALWAHGQRGSAWVSCRSARVEGERWVEREHLAGVERGRLEWIRIEASEPRASGRLQSTWPPGIVAGFDVPERWRGNVMFEHAREGVEELQAVSLLGGGTRFRGRNYPVWTAFVATAVPPLMYGIGIVRRGTRRARGLCTRCGYDLRATPAGCPECGPRPLEPRRAWPRRIAGLVTLIGLAAGGAALGIAWSARQLAAWRDEVAYRDLGVALTEAAERNDVTTIVALLDRGAPVEGLHTHRTALCAAVREGSVEAAKLLLLRGANPTSRRAYETAWSETADRPEMMELLLRHGADVHARHMMRRTLLHELAWREGSIAQMRRLLDAGADPNARDSTGATPLRLAVQSRHNQAAALLLQRGPDPDIRDNSGRRAGGD